MQGEEIIPLEAIRIGEKMLAAESLRPAGFVFDPAKKRTKLKKKKRNRHYLKPGYVVRPTKLHKMADWYRPKDPK